MGLDLFCGDYSIKMGSYSTVHIIRREWILAYIKYLESSTQKPLVLLNKLIQEMQYDKINYKTFTRISSDHEGFQGLKIFVDHSDCEDDWSYEEVESIMQTLNLIRDHLKAESSSWHFNGDDYYLEEIFLLSIANQQDIRFG